MINPSSKFSKNTSSKEAFETLLDQIASADVAYYEYDAPVMSDVEYDALRREAKAILELHPEWNNQAAALSNVGGKPSERFAKIRHRVPMLSLDSVFSSEEFSEAITRMRKFLGLATSSIGARG